MYACWEVSIESRRITVVLWVISFNLFPVARGMLTIIHDQCWVFIDAVRLPFSFFMMIQSLPFTPLLSSAYMVALFHALSYALVTSRNTSFGFCFFSMLPLMKLIIRKRWSAVDFPFNASSLVWGHVYHSLILLFIILSNSFTQPELLLRVILLSLLHFPLFPFPL